MRRKQGRWRLRSRRFSVALIGVLLFGPAPATAVTEAASELDVAVADIAFELSKKQRSGNSSRRPETDSSWMS
jgi:hypothetical protein